ncbi:uncharacterized protein LOC111062853 isoform X2 [Nilaparvata lugens]|uniref:uncharacterized protein LOC111062853 isoform X2 n=1 Tax=Nilaparvata lugens TaxID=108931 RepID=UPI00193D8A60|nr:uncharacterized protein LOC111062853 isoform X2 [Nilaparvata lugens]
MTKKKQSNIIKNVLADPYDNFWPCAEGKDEEALRNCIERFLPKAKLHRGFISHKNLRVIHREKSKERRKELWKSMTAVPPGVSKDEIAKNKENRNALVLGVNSVSRGIEHSRVACCVVCGEASGRPLVQHIVLSAARHGLPVIVLNNLRQTTNQCLGHSSAVFALKEVSENNAHVFYPLYEAIRSSAQKFPIPEHVMGSSSDDDSDNGTIKEKELRKGEVIKMQPVRKFQYLTRHIDSKSRVFVPKTIVQKRPALDFGDYIALPSDLDRLVSENIKMEYSDDSTIDESNNDEISVNKIVHHKQLPKGKDLFFIDKASRPQIASRKRKMKDPAKLKPLAVKRMKGNPKKIKKNKNKKGV